MFVNCSNHISSLWSQEQQKSALEYGQIVDYPFPNVSPYADEEELDKLAQEVLDDILNLNPAVVMCQGEFSLVYRLVNGLKENGIEVVAACSDRIVYSENQENGTSKKEVLFKFVRFRKY